VNLDEARKRIKSSNSRERLDAARILARDGTPVDLDLIVGALRSETVSWVRSSLENAETRLTGSTRAAVASLDVDESAVDDVYAEAIEETTGRLMHEITPLVGAVRMYAELEVKNFAKTKFRHQLDRLDEMLTAIDTLSRAAASPKLIEFNLADELADVVEDFSFGGVEVQMSGPDPLNIVSDPTLVCLVTKSALNNAAESTLQAHPNDPPYIALKWDATERDNWLSVLDRGTGLPPTAGKIFEIGVSGKRGHLGMGLSLATRAAQSLRGHIRLTPRDGGGVQFLFRWPRSDSPS
jgi:signal transduction histidine kinase